MNGLKIYAHRGASGRYLENTWNSFFEAKRLDVGIELDVQITLDGVVIVFHDNNLKRLTGKSAMIEKLQYSKIKHLKLGKRGRRKFRDYRIPLAYEVFRWARKHQVPLNIELKSSIATHPEGITILSAMLSDMEDLHISSFDPILLKRMKETMPETEMALIINKKTAIEAVNEMEWIDSIHCHKRVFSSGLLEKLQKIGKPVRLYGIKGYEPVIRRNRSELQGIITDFPGWVKRKVAYDKIS